jgi:[ribosomal protein S18]-alanine N-acetyltransferase
VLDIAAPPALETPALGSINLMDPSGSRVAVRNARLNDVPDLQRIEAGSFDGDRLSRRSLRRHIASRTADVLVAETGRIIVGYALVFYRRLTDIARLYSIAASPDARGLGVGRLLAEAAIAAAVRRGCARMRLEVREDNAGAIALYRKLDFIQFGRKEGYYEDGAPALRFERALEAGRRGRSFGTRAA